MKLKPFPPRRKCAVKYYFKNDHGKYHVNHFKILYLLILFLLVTKTVWTYYLYILIFTCK